MKTPETRYAKTADGVHIAYEVAGDGPVDIVFVMGWTSHIELMWEEPSLARFLTRLASFSRLILFDKRGMGLSDRVPDDRLPSLEVRMDDARAVMDAVGSERAAVFGVSEGGPMATLFAATYPERTIALVLFGTVACWKPAADYAWPVSTDEEFEREIEETERIWGTRELAESEMREWGAPTLANDDHAIRWLTGYLRHAASPGAAIALDRMNRGIDVRAALPAIHVPTLVLARDGDLAFTVEESKRMADQIHGARFVSFPGVDHFFWVGDQDQLLDEVERFVASVRSEEADSTGCSPPCCSPTSSDRRRGPRSSATAAGARSSSGITAPYGRSSAGSEGMRSIRRATGSSRRSTGLRAPCGARRRSAMPSGTLGSRFARECTRGRSRRSRARSAGSPSTLARGSRRSRPRLRSWSPRPSKT